MIEEEYDPDEVLEDDPALRDEDEGPDPDLVDDDQEELFPEYD